MTFATLTHCSRNNQRNFSSEKPFSPLVSFSLSCFSCVKTFQHCVNFCFWHNLMVKPTNLAHFNHFVCLFLSTFTHFPNEFIVQLIAPHSAYFSTYSSMLSLIVILLLSLFVSLLLRLLLSLTLLLNILVSSLLTFLLSLLLSILLRLLLSLLLSLLLFAKSNAHLFSQIRWPNVEHHKHLENVFTLCMARIGCTLQSNVLLGQKMILFIF